MFEEGHHRIPGSGTDSGAPLARAAGSIVSGARAAPLAARGRQEPQWSFQRRRAYSGVLACVVPGPAALLTPAPPNLEFTLRWLRLLPYLGSRSTPFPSLLFSVGESVCPCDKRARETS